MNITRKLIILFLAFVVVSVSSYAQSPREELKQMVEQLQKTPTDDALREKIIKRATEIKPAPAIPEKAERHMAYGTAAFTGAKSLADYKEAAKEFEQASLAAPWYGDAYFNLGVAQDKAENHAAALRNLKLAQLASPDSKDIKPLIYQVEYRNKKMLAATMPGVNFRDCPDCPVMVILPKPYAMGKYEVTQAEWRALMGNNPSNFMNCGGNCPVENVNWNDAQAYIQKLNAMTGKQYRLPTEAEWEYACYGGNLIRDEYCGGSDINAVAWYGNNGKPGGNSGLSTHPVGQKQANGYGLHDMSGNVAEWMNDCYEGDCSKRMIRGGSWVLDAQSARVWERYTYDTTKLNISFGFRLARTLP